ncbi:MAG: CoA-transferase [Dehalococcoidia bacterium]
MARVCTLDEAAALVPNGATFATTGQVEMSPVAFARALIRRGLRDLDVVVVPTGGGLIVDLLIGAGSVRSVEFAQMAMGEYGMCPNFRRAVQAGAIRVRDHVCSALLSALQAGGMGIPFIPARGIIGTDYLRARPDFTVMDNPYGGPDDERIVLVPAIRPDVGVFHAFAVDRFGNALVESSQNIQILAAACRFVVATAERVVEYDLTEEPRTLPLVSGLHVDAVVPAPRGAHPTSVAGLYDRDDAHVRRYLAAARSDETFAAYLDEFVRAPGGEATYQERVGLAVPG